MSEDNKHVPAPVRGGGVPTQVPLGGGASMDLSWLSEEERKALLVGHAKGMMDTARRAGELHVEANNVRENLHTFSENMSQMSQNGLSVTTTYTQNVQGGRIEMIGGNTDTAGKGKLTKSQTGERDWTPYYVFAGLVALVLIAVVLAGKH